MTMLIKNVPNIYEVKRYFKASKKYKNRNI